MVLLRLPDERILLASDAARELLAAGADLVGRTLREFTDGPRGSASDLLLKGHVTGFQLRRLRTGVPAQPMEIWVRALADRDGTAPALALLSQDGQALHWATEPEPAPAPSVIGWVDQQFTVQQLGEDLDRLLGRPEEEVLGRSLLSLLSPEDLPSLLFALGQATADGQAISLSVGLRRPGPSRLHCQLVLLPLDPAPSFAFSLQPAADFVGNHRSPNDLRLLLRRFGQGIAAAVAARALSVDHGRLQPRLPELTSRELQIVSRLLAGDRVPAIATQLYLAQSTVRNHLSAVFAKLGVRSQQELIVLLRTAQSRPE